MKKHLLLLVTLAALSGCIAKDGKISINVRRKNTDTSTVSSARITSVKVINNQLVINGTGLNGVTQVKVNGNSLDESFTVESISASQIIANSLRHISFDSSKIFNLIISDAEASATFQIDFSLCNATMGGAQFDCTSTPNDNDLLVYDHGVWTPKSAAAIGSLTYKGTWDATTALPTATATGQYYIITVDNSPTYPLNDWIVWNGTSYDVVHQSAVSGVSTFKGRAGAVVPTAGDYDLSKMADVDFSVAPTAGQVLKFVGGKWIADDDEVGSTVGAGSITTTELANGSVTDAKIVSMATSKLTGTIASSQITDGTIVNADISGAAAIDYSKLNIPNTTIPYAKLNIADGDIPAAKITGLPVLSSILAATVTDGDTTHAPDGNSVYDALTGKLNKTGGTLSVGTISGIPTPTNPDDVANKGYVDGFGQWTKSSSDISYSAGNVGIGGSASATASTKLKVTGDIEATTVAASTVNTGLANIAASVAMWLPMSIRNYDTTGYSGILMTDESGTSQAAFGYSNGSAPVVPGTAFFTSLVATTPVTIGIGGVEAMRVQGTTGYVGIGTNDPKARLAVNGAIVSTPPSPYAGATVDLKLSNTHVLTNVGGSAITIGNMVHGGSYTLIIQDTTSRTYTFTGCNTSKFQPSNMATIAGTHTMYNIMTVYNGATYDCYITWSSGFN